jgi:hypothetical protein
MLEGEPGKREKAAALCQSARSLLPDQKFTARTARFDKLDGMDMNYPQLRLVDSGSIALICYLWRTKLPDE